MEALANSLHEAHQRIEQITDAYERIMTALAATLSDDAYKAFEEKMRQLNVNPKRRFAKPDGEESHNHAVLNLCGDIVFSIRSARSRQE